MRVADLRGILQYVPRFRDRIFVVALDGEVIASPNFSNLLLDLAVLHSLSIKVVLVHGASYQIQKLADERGVTLSNADGTGITDDLSLRVSLDAATNVMNEIMQGLSSVDLRAAYPNAIIAHPAGILQGLDFQNTGRVERVDTRCLKLFLEQDIMPVVPPIGYDGEGRTFRVNSDSIALEIAASLGALKIIYLSASDGILVNDTLIRQLSVQEAEEFVKKKRALVPPRLLSKLEHAARACRAGVPRVHLLNGNMDEALLTEVFSPDGVGTMVYSNEYQQIRRIFRKDVRSILQLIRESVANEELVRRTRTEILSRIDDYWVIETDKHLAGCVAVHLFPEEKRAELACFYVAKSHEGQGYGRKLMAFAEQLAAERGMTHMLALSTQAYAYFQQKGGYVEVSPDSLPPERKKKWEASGRNSKVLMKTLTTDIKTT